MPSREHTYTGTVPSWSPNSVRCGTPECKRKRGHGRTGAFCKTCAANLARIRDEYLAERFSRRLTGGTGNAGKKLGRPCCCNPACDAPRPRGKAFCGDCETVYGGTAKAA